MLGRKRWAALIGFLVLCFAVAGVASWITQPELGGWYASIRTPAWNPPNWLFGPVWTTLYAMIALAGWLAWQAEVGPQRTRVLWLFAIQLVLNFAWSPLFFKLHQPGLAAIEIVFLWVAIGAFTVMAWDVSRMSSLLFIPYWAWVSFAAVLNITIWHMHRGTGTAGP